ncbi:HAMP domain-containing histidine kinase [bacterium]|nr:HAMP domain-containing histidine kinase [bacterium]
MNNFYKNALTKLETFLQTEIKTPEEVFSALNMVFLFDNACIYFVTPELLRVEHSYSTKLKYQNIELTSFFKNNIFNLEEDLKLEVFNSKNHILAERLLVKNTVYGIILLEKSTKFSDDEKNLFKTCSILVSNILKDIELTKVIKMQSEALQEGLIETAKANEIIKSQNKKILASDKIKTKFLSHVSHELRTPLNSIIGFSELLQNPKLGKLNNKQAEFVKDIQTASINLLGMINEILDISKIESGSISLNQRPFNISVCINETINILKPLLDKKNIKIIYTPESFTITADYQKLQQVLFNILNNAIKFSPEKDFITIGTTKNKKYIDIAIKDNGCGISAKHLKKIFKKFEQINPTENSTGLGLTISKELIKLHKGKILVKSEVNKGSEFTIKLPHSSV